MKHFPMSHLPEEQDITEELTSNGENSTIGRIETDGSTLYDSAPGGHGAIADIKTEYRGAFAAHVQLLWYGVAIS